MEGGEREGKEEEGIWGRGKGRRRRKKRERREGKKECKRKW